MRRILTIALAASAFACGQAKTSILAPDPADAGTRDVGTPFDAGQRDGGRPDSGVRDGGRAAPRDGGERDGGLFAACGAAPRFQVSLCGDTTPCRLTADQLVDGPHLQNGPPSIAMAADGPRLMFTGADVSSSGGVFAEPDADGAGWTLHPVRFAVASATLSIRGGETRALVDGYHGGSGVLRLGTDGWSREATFGLRSSAGGGSFTQDDNGCFHVLARGRQTDRELVYGVGTRSTFGLRTVSSDVPLGAHMALAPDGTPQFLFWDSTGPQLSLTWMTDAQRSVILRWPSGGPSASQLVPFVALPEPHVMFARQASAPNSIYEVVSGVRGPGGWTLRPLARDDLGANECAARPTMPDQTCRLDTTQYKALAVVAAATDVRYLLTSERTTGELVSVCRTANNCRWEGTPVRTGRLELMTETSTAPTVIADDKLVLSGTAVVDEIGRIHVAAAVLEANERQPSVRYLRFER